MKNQTENSKKLDGGHMLQSLHIKNFRSLEDFHVPRLGRVNLIVGKNNSGKSSVLEALRVYAGNANRELLETIAEEHDEKTRWDGPERNPSNDIPFEAFFTGRKFPQDDTTEIMIGESEQHADVLKIRHGFLVETQQTIEEDGESVIRTVRRPISKVDAIESDASISQALFIEKNDKPFRMRFDASSYRIRNSFSEIPPALPCSVVPTQFVTMEELAEEWDDIVLTEKQNIVRQALKIISPNFEDIAFVKDIEGSTRRDSKRYGKVRLSSVDFPVPLNSMGDGMVRVLQLILKSFPAENGMLLVDEFENGLHYSVQEKVWELLFDIATSLNIQVFATTHSWDCIESFCKVAIAKPDVDGVLFRVGRSVRNSDRGRVIATVFDEGQLAGITQADMEVR